MTAVAMNGKSLFAKTVHYVTCHLCDAIYEGGKHEVTDCLNARQITAGIMKCQVF